MQESQLTQVKYEYINYTKIHIQVCVGGETGGGGGGGWQAGESVQKERVLYHQAAAQRVRSSAAAVIFASLQPYNCCSLRL
jgi:hypothetical protein